MQTTADDALETGIRTLDAQHGVQVGLVNAFEQLLRRGADRALADEALARLVDFTSVHFHAEELLMRLHACPHHDAHATAHARLMAEVEEIRRLHAAGEVQASLETASRLRDWV